jgi:hypothetical protein
MTGGGRHVLTAQQAMFIAQDLLIQVKLSRLQADVGLYQALGGGWNESPDLARRKVSALNAPVSPESVALAASTVAAPR